MDIYAAERAQNWHANKLRKMIFQLSVLHPSNFTNLPFQFKRGIEEFEAGFRVGNDFFMGLDALKK